MPKKENGRTTETAVEARQGERGPTVRIVLIVSIVLVVAAFVVIGIVFSR